MTIGVGQAVNFGSGRVTNRVSESDLIFKYGAPEDTSGMRFNGLTGQLEYRAGVRITRNYPVLVGARTASFKTVAATARLTVGQVNGWSQNEYDVAPGRYLVVRAFTTGAHYLVRVAKLTGELDRPKTWRMTLSYRPLELRRADAAGSSAPRDLKGTLTFREWAGTNLILDVDVATGRTATRFDGFAPSRSASGEYAYIDGANRIVVASSAGKEVAALPAPAADAVRYGSGGARGAAISPDGRRVAVLVSRGLGHVVVIDRAGREVADFADRDSPAWTPDGGLAMANYGDVGLFLVGRDLKGAREVAAARGMRLRDLAVSPDGKRIAFEMNGRVWTMGLDGSGLKGLAATGREQSGPAWSPDGRYVAIRTHVPDSVSSNRIEIVRVADGKSFLLLDSAGSTRDADGPIIWR